ncbi:TROVE domain-containing protein [Leucobacter luti]|uniref:TROVE domain-containing protein n=1 Tax=Leucobacter luti TaxID=340320 RepID=A0A4R6RRU4_9MICO|nr:TROVE domain-containing protein [Leucobacter luti]TDP89553.1 TROVE domain-containing protein [Leucobacter luti]
MARLNTPAAPRPRTPITGESNASGSTHNGGAGYLRDEKSELFLGAVSNLNENTAYESAEVRADRLRPLIARVALSDPRWVVEFVAWLRGSANLRSVAVLVAAEAAHSRLEAGSAGHTRQIVRSPLQRADEPGEFLAYWVSRFGRNVPKPVKRGIADAARDLYSERSWLKWRGRGDAGSISMLDVLNLTHPKPKDGRQSQLFAQIVAHGYNREAELGSELSVLRARETFSKLTASQIRTAISADAQKLADAGLTHEALAGFVGKLEAPDWEALIPTMGYMALRMNLSRIVEAGVSSKTIHLVSKRLADPDEVARSRQMPVQFLAAYRNAPIQFHWPLEQAMNHSLERVPALPGRTLILVDRSGSMWNSLSERGTLNRADAAAVFGSALALRAEDATLVEFGTKSNEVKFRKSGSVLHMSTHEFGNLGGTNTRDAVQRWFDGHDRVINLTDEQSGGWGFYAKDPYEGIVPEKTPVFTWNLAGYQHGEVATGKHRHTFGGLSDIGFDLIRPIESGFIAGWPWEQTP